MGMDMEAVLITKIVETKDLHPVINSGTDKSLRLYKDIWDFIYEHYSKYKQVPTSEIIKIEFPSFEPEKTNLSVEYICEKINEQFVKDELENIIIAAASDLEDNPLSVLKMINKRMATLSAKTTIIKDIDLIRDYWIRVNSLKERIQKTDANEILGIPTLIDPIDYIFGGFQPGDFVLLMGWAGAGKTWMAIYLALNAWKMGKKALYFSLEMDDIQFGYRFDTLLAGGKFSNTSLMNAKNIKSEEYENWAKKEMLDKHPFYLITNEGLSEATQNTVQAKIDQYKPDIVFLDYHGLFDDAKGAEGQTQQVLNLSKDFKRMAVRNNIPIIDIIAVTQKEEHGERVPELNEVAWSKQLAYDSDLTLGLMKQGQIVTAVSKKTRRCEPFAFRLSWDFDAGIVSLMDWK